MTFSLSTLTLNSPDFGLHNIMAGRHGREGGNLSPALAWSKLPAGTRSVAVFCHDPATALIDSMGPWGRVHWLAYNIPAEAAGLASGCAKFSQGVNDFGRQGFDGPAEPEAGATQACYFWLVALDRQTDFPDGLRLPQLMSLLEPCVLGINRLVGKYEGCRESSGVEVQIPHPGVLSPTGLTAQPRGRVQAMQSSALRA